MVNPQSPEIETAKKLLDDIINLSKEILSQHASFKKGDCVGKLITYFMFKQLDHALSVQKLDPFMDTALIVRSMVEGVINIEFILEKPEERAKKWFDYSAVCDYDLMTRKQKGGSFVSEQDSLDVSENYKKFFSLFSIKNNKKRPHVNHRCGKTLKDVSVELDLGHFYDCYGFLSDWAHWGVQSLGNVIREDDHRLYYYEDDHPYRLPCLALATICLLEMISILKSHFEIEDGFRLEAFGKEAVRFYENNSPSLKEGDRSSEL